MGWLWNSPASKPEQPTIATPTSALEDKIFPDAQPTIPAKEPVTAPLSREEQSNQELIAWLKELQLQAAEDTKKKPKTSISDTGTSTATPDDISPESLYPTQISCQSAFDYAVYCQSFGGQFVNIYRYGKFRSCSNHWDDFWLCMRTRTWKDKEKKEAIKEHYRKRAVKYKTGPSSEDVWELRTEPIQGAFEGNFEAIEQQIKEWQKANPGQEPPFRVI